MNDFNKKLKMYFRKANISPKDISIKLGISGTMTSYYLNGQREFGGNVAIKWGQAFGIDPLWLMTKGEQGTPPTEQGMALAVSTDSQDIINIPVLNLDVRGGLSYNNAVDVEQYTIDTMPFSRAIATDGDVVVPVYGDSMSPRYPSGSHILIRPLPMWREWLELGQSYVLELADYRRTIKIIRKGENATTYRLECYNKDYDTTEIAKNLIEHVWQVLAVVKREVM